MPSARALRIPFRWIGKSVKRVRVAMGWHSPGKSKQIVRKSCGPTKFLTYCKNEISKARAIAPDNIHSKDEASSE